MGPPHPTNPPGELQWLWGEGGQALRVSSKCPPSCQSHVLAPRAGQVGAVADAHLPRVAQGWGSPGRPYLLQKAHGQHGVGSVENVVECKEPALIQRLEGNREKL